MTPSVYYLASVLSGSTSIRRSGHDQVKEFLGLLFRWRERLKSLNYKAFRVLNLAENEPDVHGGLVGLALAPAVDAMLSDKGERIGQDVEGGGEPPPYRTKLKLVLLTCFGVVFQHGLFLEVVVEPLCQIHERFEAEADRACFVIFPGLFDKEGPGDIQMRPCGALRNELL